MTSEEEAVVEYVKRGVAYHFPKSHFVQKLKELGATDLPVPKPRPDPGSRPSTARIHIRWVIRRPREQGGDVYVTMWFQTVQGHPRWCVTDYSMHFGPTPYRQDPPKPALNHYFRVCVNPVDGPHFHHHRFPNAYYEGHVPIEKSDPLISTTPDPDWFVGVLEAFLTKNKVPIEVIL